MKKSNLFALLTLSILLLAGPSMAEESPFKTSGTGALKASEVAKHPVMPWWMPVTPEATTYKYENIDMVAVAFASDQDKVEKLVPEELDLIAIPGMPGQSSVTLLFAKYRENEQTGPYMETVVAVPVLHKNVPYLYVVAIYVDSDAAMIAGREFGGYPKKIADIELYNFGNLFLSRLSRGSMQEKTANPVFYDVASSKVTRGGTLFSIPLDAEKINQLPFPYNMLLPMPKANGKPQPYVLPTIGLRTLPGIGKDADKAQVQQLVGTPWVITRATVWEGLDASIDFIPNKEDPLYDALPINMILGAFILRGDMHTDPKAWPLLEDYNK